MTMQQGQNIMSIRFEKAWIPLLTLLGVILAAAVSVTLYASSKIDRAEVDQLINLKLMPVQVLQVQMQTTLTRIEEKIDTKIAQQ